MFSAHRASQRSGTRFPHRLRYWSLLLLGTSSPLVADISVSTMRIDFAPGHPRYQDLTVSNRGGETAYITASVQYLEREKEKTIYREVPVGAKERLVASPSRAVIGPGATKVIRLFTTDQDLAEDRVYQVVIKPEEGELDLDDQGDVTAKKRLRTAVKVMVGYGVTVIVRPENLNPTFDGKREGKSLTVTNTGNTTLLFQRTSQCDPAPPGVCQNVDGKMILPHATWRTSLPYDAPIGFSYNYGGAGIEKVFQ